VRDRGGWAPGVTYLIVLAMTGITAAVSYQHEYQLAYRNGQAPWVSSLLPFTVDGMILVASVALLWAGSQGIRRPVRPLAVLAVGIGATIAANLAAGLGHGWLGAAVSAWCGVAVVLVADVAFWMLGTRRKLASGEPLHPVADCGCPPLPLTLAEWAPLARAGLEAQGRPHGEQALADAMATTRHQVKLALAPKDAPPAAVAPQPSPGVPQYAAVASPLTPGASGVPPRPPVLNGSSGGR
jgi:Protein of unknown function (DUF2637)